jgi:hypothetical protein
MAFSCGIRNASTASSSAASMQSTRGRSSTTRQVWRSSSNPLVVRRTLLMKAMCGRGDRMSWTRAGHSCRAARLCGAGVLPVRVFLRAGSCGTCGLQFSCGGGGSTGPAGPSDRSRYGQARRELPEGGSPGFPASRTTTALLSSSAAQVHVACAEQPASLCAAMQTCGARTMVGVVMEGQNSQAPAAIKPTAVMIAFVFMDRSSGLFSGKQCGAACME